MNSRRRFLYISLTAIASAPLYWLLKKYTYPIQKTVAGRMLGASYQRGHNLFKLLFGKVTEITQKHTVIIGGGISGLSTARTLIKNDHTDFLLL